MKIATRAAQRFHRPDKPKPSHDWNFRIHPETHDDCIYFNTRVYLTLTSPLASRPRKHSDKPLARKKRILYSLPRQVREPRARHAIYSTQSKLLSPPRLGGSIQGRRVKFRVRPAPGRFCHRKIWSRKLINDARAEGRDALQSRACGGVIWSRAPMVCSIKPRVAKSSTGLRARARVRTILINAVYRRCGSAIEKLLINAFYLLGAMLDCGRAAGRYVRGRKVWVIYVFAVWRTDRAGILRCSGVQGLRIDSEALCEWKRCFGVEMKWCWRANGVSLFFCYVMK